MRPPQKRAPDPCHENPIEGRIAGKADPRRGRDGKVIPKVALRKKPQRASHKDPQLRAPADRSGHDGPMKKLGKRI